MKCAVITPVGPGHERAYEEAKLSVSRAYQHSPGLFTDIDIIRIDDTRAELGRSRARNIGVSKAIESGCEWIFFLDADDLMCESAFSDVSPFLNDYDAVWGLIAEQDWSDESANLRLPQLPTIDSLPALILADPFITLQMGHFIKSELAVRNPFNVDMDTGEDFEYYLSVWRYGRCVKTELNLFINRRGRHSTGPRSADGRMWRVAVEGLINKERTRLKQQGKLNNIDEIIACNSVAIASYIARHVSVNTAQMQELSQRYPIREQVEIGCGKEVLRVRLDNDDQDLLEFYWKESNFVANLAGLSELASGQVIYNIGSYTGISSLYIAMSRQCRVIAFEQGSWGYLRSLENIKLNQAEDLVSAFHGVPSCNSQSLRWVCDDSITTYLPKFGLARHPAAHEIELDTINISDKLDKQELPPPDTIIIRGTMPVMSLLILLKPILNQHRPDIVLELVANGDLAELCLPDFLLDDENLRYVPFEVNFESGNIIQSSIPSSVETRKIFLLRCERA